MAVFASVSALHLAPAAALGAANTERGFVGAQLSLGTIDSAELPTGCFGVAADASGYYTGFFNTRPKQSAGAGGGGGDEQQVELRTPGSNAWGEQTIRCSSRGQLLGRRTSFEDAESACLAIGPNCEGVMTGAGGLYELRTGPFDLTEPISSRRRSTRGCYSSHNINYSPYAMILAYTRPGVQTHHFTNHTMKCMLVVWPSCSGC